jgi:hypothetical protein
MRPRVRGSLGALVSILIRLDVGREPEPTLVFCGADIFSDSGAMVGELLKIATVGAPARSVRLLSFPGSCEVCVSYRHNRLSTSRRREKIVGGLASGLPRLWSPLGGHPEAIFVKACDALGPRCFWQYVSIAYLTITIKIASRGTR